MTKLEEAVNEYRKVQEQLDAKKSELALRKGEFDKQNQQLIDDITELKECMVHFDSEVRLAAIDEFRSTGIKKLFSGVGIRCVPLLTYDEAKALEWALEHKMALKLDNTAFEKLVKADPKQFPFVEIDNDAPTATIPKKWPEPAREAPASEQEEEWSLEDEADKRYHEMKDEEAVMHFASNSLGE